MDAIPDDVEVRGEPFESLPDRPVRRAELTALQRDDAVEEVRIPEHGSTVVQAGRAVTDEDPRTVSEFVLTRGGTTWHFVYGYPEVESGDLDVPDSDREAADAGYVRWWYAEPEGAASDEGGVTTWDWYREQTTPLER